jgi:SAM-dependent methyltransferase
MLIYSEFADWYHLLTHPDEYAEEAAAYRDAILAHAPTQAPAQAPTTPRTLLELGAGGGGNAFHLKRDFTCTLTDLSPEMLAQSQKFNPECEHIVGDMRDLRLGRSFDAVFVHDAIAYMLTEADLRRAIETVYIHCKPGGVALFAPDYVLESFEPSTDHGGNDGPPGDDRSLRYLEWVHPHDPATNTYRTDYVCVLREGDAPTRVIHDSNLEGLFPRATWLRLLDEAGFDVHIASRPVEDDWNDEVYVGIRRV